MLTISKMPYFPARNIGFGKNVDVEIKDKSIDIKSYTDSAVSVINDVNDRVKLKAKDYYLEWIGDLPNEQLTKLDSIYAKAKSVPQPGQIKDLVVVGIGGPRHTTESIVNLVNPQPRKVNVHYYAGADKESFERLKQQIDPKKTLVLVVSKSGTTKETKNGYEQLRKLIESSEGVGPEEAKSRFVATTMATPKSELRQEVNNGKIKTHELLHDNVGGRFSIFDGSGLFLLAYLGMPKEDMKKMLEASRDAQKDFLSTDLNKNTAMKRAIFNEASRSKGKQIHGIEMFGDAFKGAALWKKQMDNESIKNQPFSDVNVGPAFLHYNAEGDLHKANNNSFYTFINVKTDRQKDKTFSDIMEGVVGAYSKQHPVAHVTLKDLKPETIGEYVELEHFTTLYTGMLGRKNRGETTPIDKILPEVDQPNVEIYKEEVRKAAAKP